MVLLLEIKRDSAKKMAGKRKKPKPAECWLIFRTRARRFCAALYGKSIWPIFIALNKQITSNPA